MRAVSGDLESRERRGSTNSKLVRPNLAKSVNRLEHAKNILESSKIIKMYDLFPWNV